MAATCDACLKSTGGTIPFEFNGRQLRLHPQCIRTFEANLVAQWNKAVERATGLKSRAADPETADLKPVSRAES